MWVNCLIIHWDIMYCIALSGMYYNPVMLRRKNSGDDEYLSINFLTYMERQRDQSNPWEITFGRYDHVTPSYIYCILFMQCFEVYSRFWKDFKHLLQFLFVSIVVVIVLLHYRTFRNIMSLHFCVVGSYLFTYISTGFNGRNGYIPKVSQVQQAPQQGKLLGPGVFWGFGAVISGHFFCF